MHAGVRRSSNAHSRTCVALTSASTATPSISTRSLDAFAAELRPSYKSLEAEASTVSAVESRYQTPLLGAHAGFVRSCSYGCKEAAWEADPECHCRGCCAARRSPVVVLTLPRVLTLQPVGVNGEKGDVFWEMCSADSTS